MLMPVRREDHRGCPWHDTRAVLRTGAVVARAAGEVSAVPDLPPAASSKWGVRSGELEGGVASVGAASVRTRQAESG